MNHLEDKLLIITLLMKGLNFFIFFCLLKVIRKHDFSLSRFSMSRLNAYKAMSSPSLIALTSKDPILTAFKLSNQLKSLSKMESQFCKEYTVLREQVQVNFQ